MRCSVAKRLSNKQAGVVAVELAVMVPILLLLMLSVAEIGRMLYQYNTLVKSTRDGARYAASNAAFGSTGIIIVDNTPGSDWSVMKSNTANLVACGFVNCSGTTPVLSNLGSNNVNVYTQGHDRTHVIVSVTYTYQPFFAAALPMFGYGPDVDIGISMQSALVMRAL